MQLFEDQPIRTAWDEENEEWYFSIVDVVEALTKSKDATAYWRKLKQRLKKEGNETATTCHGLKMIAADPHGLEENQKVTKSGGAVAGNARREIEDRTGRSVLTSQNAAQLNGVVIELIEDIAKEND